METLGFSFPTDREMLDWWEAPFESFTERVT